VVDVQLDKATNRLATPTCPDDYEAAFVAGTEPRDTCDQQAGVAGFFNRLFGGGEKPLPPAQDANAQNSQDPKKKKGFFGKIAGIFKDDKAPTTLPKPPDTTQTAPHSHCKAVHPDWNLSHAKAQGKRSRRISIDKCVDEKQRIKPGQETLWNTRATLRAHGRTYAQDI
jgi:hypothetical protein